VLHGVVVASAQREGDQPGDKEAGREEDGRRQEAAAGQVLRR